MTTVIFRVADALVWKGRRFAACMRLRVDSLFRAANRAPTHRIRRGGHPKILIRLRPGPPAGVFDLELRLVGVNVRHLFDLRGMNFAVRTRQSHVIRFKSLLLLTILNSAREHLFRTVPHQR